MNRFPLIAALTGAGTLSREADSLRAPFVAWSCTIGIPPQVLEPPRRIEIRTLEEQ